MSKYHDLDMIRKGVKIYKFQNKRSAVDLTHILNSYREKTTKNNSLEYLYSGRICFSIAADGKYQQAYLSKLEAKMLFNSVLQGNFTKKYPNGFESFKGGEKENRKVFSKKLSIYVDKWNDKNKVFIAIEEMPGKKTKSGAYIPVGKAYERVNTMLDPENFLEMAIECLDFIRAAEVAGMLQRKPLHTLTNIEYEKIDQDKQKTLKNKILDDKTDLSQMDPKEFYQYYLFIKKKFEEAQNEYDIRVARKQNAQQNFNQNRQAN